MDALILFFSLLFRPVYFFLFSKTLPLRAQPPKRGGFRPVCLLTCPFFFSKSRRSDAPGKGHVRKSCPFLPQNLHLWRCLFAAPAWFFPRASERRVLPIVGVCKTSSHLHILSSSHLHILSSSHLLIFTSSHLHILSSSHLLIFTSSHLHIFSSSHLHIFSSSHLLILPSSHLLISHLLIFSHPLHLHILSSSHLLIFTSSHLHIFSSSHLLIFTSSHLHIISSSHLLIFIFSSSHLLIFSSLHLLISHLLLLPSCPLLLFYFFLEGGSRGSGNETARNATLSHEMRFDRQKLR